ncbi:MAG: hypothetical protein WAZ18_01530 [Alphaproteobacteria bacterium]
MNVIRDLNWANPKDWNVMEERLGEAFKASAWEYRNTHARGRGEVHREMERIGARIAVLQMAQQSRAEVWDGRQILLRDQAAKDLMNFGKAVLLGQNGSTRKDVSVDVAMSFVDSYARAGGNFSAGHLGALQVLADRFKNSGDRLKEDEIPDVAELVNRAWMIPEHEVVRMDHYEDDKKSYAMIKFRIYFEAFSRSRLEEQLKSR